MITQIVFRSLYMKKILTPQGGCQKESCIRFSQIVSARETKDDDSEDVSDEEERRPSKEETPIQDVVKDNRDLKNEENPSKEELADIDSEEFLDDDIEDEQEFIEDEERISEIEALGGRKVDLASDSNATYVAYVEFTKSRASRTGPSSSCPPA